MTSKYLILNDTHLAAARKGGTTPQSAEALHQFLLSEFKRILWENMDKDLIHAGDLFDEMEVPNRFVLEAHNILSEWLVASKRQMYLVRANHDWHPAGRKLSAWELLVEILVSSFPEQVSGIYGEFTHVEGNIYAIGHAANSDIFELELERAIDFAPSVEGKKILILHANYLNPFAAKSDHSLSVDEDMLARLVEAGYQVLGAHEHQARSLVLTNGKFKTLSEFEPDADLIVLGNQTPSSIADCLSHGQAQRDGKKYAHVIEGKDISRLETWNNTGNFISVEWSDLARVEDQKFIRVTGKITKEQSAEVLSVIAKFRSKSKAFVVANSLQVEGVTLMESEDEFSAEDIRSFNIVEEFLALFSGKEQAVLKPILEDIK